MRAACVSVAPHEPPLRRAAAMLVMIHGFADNSLALPQERQVGAEVVLLLIIINCLLQINQARVLQRQQQSRQPGSV